MEITFPSDFLWGAAISSYQCEGGNYNCDWYLWEKSKNLQPAGLSCDHYNRFPEDFQLAKSLNLKALRFSLEWSRICPARSVFLAQEIAHYAKVLDKLNQLNLKPIVTLHHFTNPLWFSSASGWLKAKNIDYWLDFVHKTVSALKEKVEYWLVINEPLVYIYNGFIRGIWPPGHKSLTEAAKVLKNMTRAYLLAYQEINNIYKHSDIKPQVSLAKSLRLFTPCSGFDFFLNCLAVSLRNKLFNFDLLDNLARKKALDFIGLNYYCIDYTRFFSLFGGDFKYQRAKTRKNQLGWPIDSQGFYQVLISLKKFGLPIIVTENGTTEKEMPLYQDYLSSHLRSLAKAYAKGVNIKGYCWWSLLDNFEWAEGFEPRFGLINVDYKTLKRRPKLFSKNYAKIIKANKLTIDNE